MGQKVNPNALRYQINRNWISRWETNDNKQAARWIIEDEQVRKFFLNKYKTAQIVEIEIDRTQKSITVVVKAGQPGLISGANNANEKDNILAVNKIVGRKIKVNLSIAQYENVAVSARVIAREIADAIENRVSFRVAQKMGIAKAMRAHAKGIKTNVSGRLGGVEMAREEGYSQGVIPLSTFRANIDYALEEAHTTYGQIGVKVWINRGDVFKNAHYRSPNFKKQDGKKPFDPKRRRRPRNVEVSANVLKLNNEAPAKAQPKKDGE
ncbi:MAG: 30S ribosomal protein S3 [Mycoplasmoidaceae bacterium]